MKKQTTNKAPYSIHKKSNANCMIFMFSDWVPFLAYPNLFGIKGFVVVVVVVVVVELPTLPLTYMQSPFLYFDAILSRTY
jgi:hypothetical protein